MTERTAVRNGIDRDLDVGGFPGLDGPPGPTETAVAVKSTLEVA